MQSTRPVDAEIATSVIQFDSRIDWASAWYLRKLEEAWEPWAIVFANIELVFILFDLFAAVGLLASWADLAVVF